MTPTVLVALVVAIAPASAQTSQDAPRSTILVDAVAVDKDGMPVTNLKPDDLEIWIGHFRVPVERLELVKGDSDNNGRLVILLMDDITTPLPEMERAREIARRFTGRLLPGDQMAVVMLSNPSIESTNDPAALRRAIDRFSVRATGVMRTDELGRHVLRTVERIAAALTEAGEGRKVIVGIGSGWLFDRPLPPPLTGADLLPEWVSAMRAMSRSHAAFYVVDSGGVGMRSTISDGGDSGFARETGGHAFLSTNDGKGAADRILRETGSYYLIRVGNPPVGGSGLRELEIKSLRRGVTIRARRAIH